MSTNESRAGWVNVQKARAFIKRYHPYFYRILLGCIVRDSPGLGTLGVTDSMLMDIDMSWFSTLDVEVAAGCIIHEANHIQRDMSRIAAMPDQRIAGIAFDIPINDDLKKFGIKLPPWAIYSSSYDLKPGLSGEGYYHLLKSMKLPPHSGPGVCAGKCGSCAGTPDHASIKKDEGRSKKEVEYFRKIGAQDIRDFIRAKKLEAGKYPGSWEEFLEFDKEVPVVPWQSILGHKMSRTVGRIRSGHADYSLRRPSRRSYFAGILRPGLIDYTPPVVIIEDTSLSMGAVQAKENRVELIKMLQLLGIEDVWYIAADTVVQTKPKKIRARDLLTMPLVGRGGTSFIPPIEAAMKLRPRPELIFYSTDGGGTAPSEKPARTEFVWLLAPGSWTVSPCNWGIQILTTNDQDERKKYKILA